MGNSELITEIGSYLSHVRNKTQNDKINICAYVYQKLVQMGSDVIKTLRFFYEDSYGIDSSESEDVEVLITEDVAKSLQKQYSAVVSSMLEQLLSKNLLEDEFYQKIWEVITETPSFDDDNARIFALYYIWIDDRIPYFRLENGLTMSNNEFKELSQTILINIHKARFILRTPMFNQKTARASVLLKLLDEFSDKKQRAVLMAHIIAMLSDIDLEALKKFFDRLEKDFTD